jgi:hypothetical protein
MALIPLCTGDPLLDTLRETFAATPLRIPETRVQPLAVLAAAGDNASFRGQLEPLLAGRRRLEIPTGESAMAALAGKRSRSIRWNLGLKILDGFLRGLGLSGTGFAANMQGAEQVSYSFANLLRRFVDLNQLGHALSGRRIRRTNPAAAIFFGSSKYALLVIDSVITSNRFSLHVDRAAKSGFSMDLPAMRQLAATAGTGLALESTTGLDLTFQTATRLTFAFSAVRFYLGPDGSIEAMPPAISHRALSTAGRGARLPAEQVRYSPDRVLFGHRPGLLEWEERA